MSKSIHISPKHGLNPTIPVCFFCGGEKNEVALLGKLEGDAEAPRNAIFDYEPCDKCKELMAKGITVVAAAPSPQFDSQPPIHEGAYPTGSWCVIKREALANMSDDEAFVQSVLDRGMMLMEQAVFEKFFGDKETENAPAEEVES